MQWRTRNSAHCTPSSSLTSRSRIRRPLSWGRRSECGKGKGFLQDHCPVSILSGRKTFFFQDAAQVPDRLLENHASCLQSAMGKDCRLEANVRQGSLGEPPGSGILAFDFDFAPSGLSTWFWTLFRIPSRRFDSVAGRLPFGVVRPVCVFYKKIADNQKYRG